MSSPVFIGDEVSAAAYRLAGVRVRTPPQAEMISTLHWARAEAPLVLISAEYAALLPERDLAQALAGLSPPVLVVGDVRGRYPAPDLAARMRRQLGVEST